MMKVFVEMPIDTPFKVGDIVLQDGYRITNTDGEKATHEEIRRSPMLFRPSDTALAEGSDPARVLELSGRLRSLAKEIESL